MKYSQAGIEATGQRGARRVQRRLGHGVILLLESEDHRIPWVRILQAL